MRDPRGDWGRLEGRAAHEQLSDTMSALRFVMKVITLPFWLPGWFIRRRRRQQDMVEFSLSLATRDAKDHREMALRWVLAHPNEYILGEYDPKRRKADRAFRKIMRRNARLRDKR